MRYWFALIALLCAVNAEAVTRYVSTTGNDANSCATSQTIGTPKRNFTGGSGALACLAAGDTLFVCAGACDGAGTGTFNETISNGIASGTNFTTGKVRIAAYAGETVWLKPLSGNWGIYFGSDVGGGVVSPAYIEFDGINLDCTSVADACFLEDIRGGGLPNHIRIQNAEVHHREGPGQGNAALTVQGDDSEFINLRVDRKSVV